MDLTRLLPKENCLVRQKSTASLTELLPLMIEPLVASGIVTDAEQFLKDTLIREEQMTTVAGHQVALPHGRSSAVSRLGLSVLLLDENEEQLFVEGESESSVKVIFLIAIPVMMPASHLPLLRHLAKFISQERRVGKLLKSRTSAAAVKYLLSFKG